MLGLQEKEAGLLMEMDTIDDWFWDTIQTTVKFSARGNLISMSFNLVSMTLLNYLQCRIFPLYSKSFLFRLFLWTNKKHWS